MSQLIREVAITTVSQGPEENRLVREAVNYIPPPPKRSRVKYDPNKQSQPHEWRIG